MKIVRLFEERSERLFHYLKFKRLLLRHSRRLLFGRDKWLREVRHWISPKLSFGFLFLQHLANFFFALPHHHLITSLKGERLNGRCRFLLSLCEKNIIGYYNELQFIPENSFISDALTFCKMTGIPWCGICLALNCLAVLCGSGSTEADRSRRRVPWKLNGSGRVRPEFAEDCS
jgi:hypothetical protein